ncbi:hypothetical protein [Streptomyces sp. NPDC057702]|uniref:hypothetical protein n=1 Tax=unclassified Streptomyces TaxID=2593676 RepID=UPI00367A7312
MPAPVPLRLTGARSAAVVVAALAVGGALPVGAAPAVAAQGADVRVHGVDTPVRDPRDERTVCAFYLVASDVPGTRDLTWRIDPRPNPRQLPGIDGTLVIDQGSGHTGPYTLPSGTYELAWTSAGEGREATRRKAFTVDCPPGDEGQPPTNDPLPSSNEAQTDTPDTTPQPRPEPKPEPEPEPERPEADEDWLADALQGLLAHAPGQGRDRPESGQDEREAADGAERAATGQRNAPRDRADRQRRAATAQHPAPASDRHAGGRAAAAVPAASARQPHGGVAAGGGGTADDERSTPIGVGTALAAGAVGAVGLVVGHRARRRSGRPV